MKRKKCGEKILGNVDHVWVSRMFLNAVFTLPGCDNKTLSQQNLDGMSKKTRYKTIKKQKIGNKKTKSWNGSEDKTNPTPTTKVDNFFSFPSSKQII